MPFSGFAVGLIVCYIAIVILFGATTEYALPNTQSSNIYELWSNIHVVAFVGFSVLLSFSANTSLTATGLSLVLGSVAALWYMLNHGLWSQAIGQVRPLVAVRIGRDELVRADYAVTSVLVAFGVVIGRVTALQALVMTVIHVLFYSVNESIGQESIRMNDPGGSMTIHLFGALFGATCALVLDRQESRQAIGGESVTTPTSSVRAMLGTLFLFCYFPSFNCYFSAVGRVNINLFHTPYCVANTYLSILTAVLVAVAMSRIINGRTLVEDVQSSVLAGGVIIAAVSNVYVNPFGAIAIGFLGAVTAVFGVNKVAPALKAIGLRETRATLFVHGLPGLLGGLISAVAAGAAVVNYAYSFPSMIWTGYTAGYSQPQVAARQIAYLVLTIGMSIVGGAVAGILMRFAPSLKRYYTDAEEWEL